MKLGMVPPVVLATNVSATFFLLPAATIIAGLGPSISPRSDSAAPGE